jgi:hypothetical protein
LTIKLTEGQSTTALIFPVVIYLSGAPPENLLKNTIQHINSKRKNSAIDEKINSEEKKDKDDIQ